MFSLKGVQTNFTGIKELIIAQIRFQELRYKAFSSLNVDITSSSITMTYTRADSLRFVGLNASNTPNSES